MDWWERVPGHKWVDLEPHLGRISELANTREEQKTGVPSRHQFEDTRPSHFKGLCGELAVSLATGIPFNEEMYGYHGDEGHDFTHNGLRYDVKTVTHWGDPDLKEFLKPKVWSDRYILVALRSERWTHIVGWASGAQLQSAGIVDYGWGPRRNISHRELHEMGQMGLPPDMSRDYLAHCEPE